MIVGLLRHGESQANVRGLLSSEPSDPFHLTDLGGQQIRSLKGDEFFAQPPAALYSSPFFRTLESATLIQEHILSSLDVPLVLDSRISEMGYGLYSGKTIDETDIAVRETFRRSLAGDFLIKMSETGESRKQFFLRTYSFLASLLEQYEEDQRILVVTHSSVIAVLEKLWIRLINPSFVRESTKNAQFKRLPMSKNDIKLIKQEIDKLLLRPEYSDAQHMQCTNNMLSSFTPAVENKVSNNDSVLIFHLASNKFYKTSTLSNKPADSWFAGYLKTSHLFAGTHTMQLVFVQAEAEPTGQPIGENMQSDFVARYCQKFYPVQQKKNYA